MQQSSSQELVSPHVLIISTDVNIIKLFHTGLQIAGYNAVGYQYGLKVLEIVKSVKPSLVIFELSSPNNDNLKFFKELREEVTQKCPIFVIMGESDNYILQMNADAFIVKPFDFDEVVERVNSFIGHLNPQLSRPRKGYLFPIDKPPPDLPGHLRDWLNRQE